MKAYETNSKIQFQLEDITEVSGYLAKKLNKKSSLVRHYNVFEDELYYKFGKINENIELDLVNK